MNLESQILNIPIEDILPNRFQPRLNFDDSALKELAASIKEHGIIQPLVVRRLGEKYEIIAGERRYKAAKMAGLTSVPAIISSITDSKSAEVAIVENVQRKDLSSIEEAKSYKMLLDKGYLTQDELAKKMGLSQSAISNKLRLLSLSSSVQEALMAGKISERHARSLLQIDDSEEQNKWLDKIIEERLTVKELDRRIKEDTASNEDQDIVSPSPKEEIKEQPKAETEEKVVKDTPKKLKDDDSDEIPLVTMSPNIDEIKKKATDILAPQKEDIVDISQNSSVLGTENSKMPNKFFNFLEYEEANMNIGDDTPVDISKEETVSSDHKEIASEDINEDKKEETPEEVFNGEENTSDTKDAEEIEMLDFLAPESTSEDVITNDKETVDMSDAIDLINKLKDDLKDKNYKFEVDESKEDNELKYIITIKKDS